MTCRDARNALILDMEDLLDGAAKAALDAHCAACAACAQEGARLRALATLLTEARAAESGAPARVAVAWRLPRAPRPLWRAAWTAAALAVAVGAGFGGGWWVHASRAAAAAPGQLQVESIEASGMPEIGVRYATLQQASLRAPVASLQAQRLLLEAIEHPANAGMRLEAMRLLAPLGTAVADAPALRRALIEALRDDPNPGVRLRALEGLQPWVAQPAPDPALVAALAQAAGRDPNPGVQAQAVSVLASAPGSAALLRRLGDETRDASVRWSCAAALHQQGDAIPADWLTASAASGGNE